MSEGARGWEEAVRRLQGEVEELRARLAESLQLIERLRHENAGLRGHATVLKKQLDEVAADNKALLRQLDEAQRRAVRQAAPFRRSESRKVPEEKRKRPGRSKGHLGVRRVVPPSVDEHVEVPLAACPSCGGALENVRPIEQFIEEIPPVRPWVTRLLTYRGCCANCGEVQSTHLLKTSGAAGATKVQLGPRARAMAVVLNKQHGLTTRVACRVLRELAGLRLSAGGLTRIARRVGWKAEFAYDALIADLRAAAAVYADETSWYVGCPNHWLWVFTTPTETVYRVELSRGRAVVTETLGPDFGGVVSSDCLASYENLPYRMQKCVAHHHKAIREARERPDTKDPSLLGEFQGFLRAAVDLWRTGPSLAPETFAARRAALEERLDQLLAKESVQPGDRLIRNRIAKRRASILTFLHDPAVEPTNNRAERALRPAVIARKLSCGNKTGSGKRAFEVLRSVTETCVQRGHDTISYLAALLPLAARADPIPPAIT